MGGWGGRDRKSKRVVVIFGPIANVFRFFQVYVRIILSITVKHPSIYLDTWAGNYFRHCTYTAEPLPPNPLFAGACSQQQLKSDDFQEVCVSFMQNHACETHVCMIECMWLLVNICVYVCVCICRDICIYMCIYIYIYIHIYMYIEKNMWTHGYMDRAALTLDFFFTDTTLLCAISSTISDQLLV